MINQKTNYPQKALNILLSDFSIKGYGEFVREEVAKFLSGEKDSFGFLSEGDDVSIDIQRDKCTLEYDIWDKDVGEFIKGQTILQVDEVIRQMLLAAGK